MMDYGLSGARARAQPENMLDVPRLRMICHTLTVNAWAMVLLFTESLFCDSIHICSLLVPRQSFICCLLRRLQFFVTVDTEPIVLFQQLLQQLRQRVPNMSLWNLVLKKLGCNLPVTRH